MKSLSHILVASLLASAVVVLFSTGCNTPGMPKPKGYFKIDFPKHQYQPFDEKGYPYTFEYPVYGRIVKDTTFFDQHNPYWINVDFPQFNGRIYISYMSIGEKTTFKVKTPAGYKDSLGVNTFDKLVNDAFNLTSKHIYKASSIDQTLVQPQPNVTGFIFEVGGNAATNKQFFLTDSTKHFIRGALYFDATPNEDSLGIVNKFIFEDIKHLINTLRWR